MEHMDASLRIEVVEISYCRWSTDDFQCDLYIYETFNNTWAIHVAGNKVIFTDELPPEVPFDSAHVDEWVARHNKVMAMIGDAERVPLNLPYDGDYYELRSAEEAAKKVAELIEAGYRCPDYVIPEIEAEASH